MAPTVTWIDNDYAARRRIGDSELRVIDRNDRVCVDGGEAVDMDEFVSSSRFDHLGSPSQRARSLQESVKLWMPDSQLSSALKELVMAKDDIWAQRGAIDINRTFGNDLYKAVMKLDTMSQWYVQSSPEVAKEVDSYLEEHKGLTIADIIEFQFAMRYPEVGSGLISHYYYEGTLPKSFDLGGIEKVPYDQVAYVLLPSEEMAKLIISMHGTES